MTSTASIDPGPPDPAALAAGLRSALAPRLADALDQLLGAARTTGAHLYVVGGVPRDLLLGRCPPGSLSEVDLTVTAGHAGLLAAWPLDDGRLVTHPRFGTRSWSDGRVRLDLVQARAEMYRRPGALPEVRPGSLAEDLARRDFGINAMAWGLSGPDEGLLLDPHGGRTDLARGQLRVLHGGSFRDDPTRVWRGLRYARRLGFALAAETAALIPACLPVMAAVSGRRLAAELGRVWSEPDPAGLMEDLERAAALAAVAKGLEQLSEGAQSAAAAVADGADADSGTAVFLLRQATAVRRAAAARLDLSGSLQLAIDRAGAILDGFGSEPPSDATLLRLDRIGPAALGLLAGCLAGGGQRRPGLSDALTRQREPGLVDGDDLMQAGLPPGPRLGRVLAALRAGQLRGDLRSRADALRSLSILTSADEGRILASGESKDA